MGAFHVTYTGKHGNIVRVPARAYPGEHIVVTTVNGRRVGMRSVDDLRSAIRAAIKLGNIKRKEPAVVDVVCWNFVELWCALGLHPDALTVTFDEVVAALMTVLREAPDPYDREQALLELGKMMMEVRR